MSSDFSDGFHNPPGSGMLPVVYTEDTAADPITPEFQMRSFTEYDYS